MEVKETGLTVASGSGLKLFENEKFGGVCAAMIDGEPWFVGKDVANSLGYENPTKAVRDHVDDDDKKMGVQNGTPSVTDSMGRVQYPTFINESGVYALAFSSKLPTAKEFKHWVTSEVLPSIRKHGMYATPDTVEKMLADPDTMITVLQELKKERQARLESEAKRKELEPKAAVYDKLAEINSTWTLSDTAKAIHCGMGSHKFVERLILDKYIFRPSLANKYELKPYQKWIDEGLFEVKERHSRYSTTRTFPQVRVTFKGREHFLRKYGTPDMSLIGADSIG